ncbi:uncharacterized protein GGS25DRAFT_501520 [Hypoxylon fragiforme]|uniref:uncharacterized protein n=1 Tax=Hypoxylon fragiforme TaxID=63214 RepID=UPI0020C6D6EF|nr:uncharacterized protein GGS25DRAFT_501520 [Hypoxylon fragiforme]KAI2606494.1 hypothetical protein GGS25DRAFT_501520 [Hypoxylon fragiforme]
MRVPSLNSVPLNFSSVVRTSRFENGVPLLTQYTGRPFIDQTAFFLVAAFLAGPLAWDAGERAQQVYFLLGYPVPSVALYYGPRVDVETAQWLTALWQVSPILVSPLLLVFSFFASPSMSASSKAAPPKKNAAVKHLKRLYLITGLISAAVHLGTLYVWFTSAGTNPQLSLSHTFLPNRQTWKDSMVLGMHYIFQWDLIGTQVMMLAWAWLAVMDVLRVLRIDGKSNMSDYVKAVLARGLRWL